MPVAAELATALCLEKGEGVIEALVYSSNLSDMNPDMAVADLLVEAANYVGRRGVRSNVSRDPGQ